MTAEHTLTAWRVKIATELQQELNRWTDLPESAQQKTDILCWQHVCRETTPAKLAEELENVAEYYWQDYSADVEPDEPKKKHQAQNRKDFKAGAARIIKRHREATQAAKDAGIL